MKRSWASLEPLSIDRALNLWHELGREEFISRTRFRESLRYVVLDRGEAIDSKPLLAMAYQIQFDCAPGGIPSLSGGDQTRAILKGLGYELVDTQKENQQKLASTHAMIVGPNTKFWWANETVDFETAYGDEILWAPQNDPRGQEVDHTCGLNDLAPGDVVFHYATPELRGISRVATFPAVSYPPPGYRGEEEDRKGTLVLTEPVQQIHVPLHEALALLQDGPGPAAADGRLRNGYLFRLAANSAAKLLRVAGVEVISEDSAEGGENRVPLDGFMGSASDRLAVVVVRAEQSFLRKRQLHRWGPRCSLCAQSFPEELLVAAHIKPRWACSEDERRDTRNVSMLACLMGCDALFERGYIFVGEQGLIEAGPRRSTDVEDRMQDVVGLKCLAYGKESDRYFAWHREHHSGRDGVRRISGG